MSQQLAAVLKDARKRLRLTQLSVAEHLGVTRAAVGQWETTGQISTENLIKLCTLLNIEVQSAVEGTVVDAIDAGRLRAWRERLEAAGDALSLLSQQMNLKRRMIAADEPSYNTGEIPLYSLSSAKSKYINAAIGEKPMLMIPFKGHGFMVRHIYAVSIDRNILGSSATSDVLAYANGEITPRMNDEVVAVLNDKYYVDEKSTSMFPSSHPAIVGTVLEFGLKGLTIASHDRSQMFTIPLATLRSLHRLFRDVDELIGRASGKRGERQV